MKSNHKLSYGGFLPIELNPGKEWFEEYKQNCRTFNTVKAGLHFLLREQEIRSISIPYYYCPTTIMAIRNTGIDVHFYHIQPNLLPDPAVWCDDAAVLLVNYFGVLDNVIEELVNDGMKKNVVVDNAHAFFASPLFQDNIFTLYSAKKFFGVPDGAYLIGKRVTCSDEKAEYAADYVHYSIVAYEQGTNAAYREKKQVDEQLAGRYSEMSVFTHGLMCNVDYERVRMHRQKNYEFLYHKLSDINQLPLTSSAVAYMFPLLCDKGAELKKWLIQRKVYVPTLWDGEDLRREATPFEFRMKNDGVFLPVDQRYDFNDMDYLVGLIKEFMRENT